VQVGYFLFKVQNLWKDLIKRAKTWFGQKGEINKIWQNEKIIH
jgi:hypothetical protein